MKIFVKTPAIEVLEEIQMRLEKEETSLVALLATNLAEWQVPIDQPQLLVISNDNIRYQITFTNLVSPEKEAELIDKGYSLSIPNDLNELAGSVEAVLNTAYFTVTGTIRPALRGRMFGFEMNNRHELVLIFKL